jgi:1-deoxy-D-xylulose-5-phosphate synthase
LSILILERIQSPADIKKLNERETVCLCQELREYLLREVSKTGGHLASNLGVVELTVAIHKVFDTQTDRLVFDVGHQCYVHKALTGRRELFDTLRQFNGLSGFPKPYESEHDAFIAGHASNSVSVALGMARARTIQQADYNVLALVGDGALSGGLSFEGLNNAGASGEPLIVILNDNGMSINRNVGGISRHLTRLRSQPEYYHLKKWFRDATDGNAVGQAVYHMGHNLKNTLKKNILPGSSFFEDMGFTYMGPVDGHDVEKLVTTLRWAKELNRPVLLHVNTVKGKGYSYAEANPGAFHGVSPFDIATGKPLQPGTTNFSTVFGQTMTELAAGDPTVCAVTAAMADGTGLTEFAKRYPKRFFDVGIAEGHAVSMTAGMAKQGLHPVFAVYSSFLQRGFDMLIHDVALDQIHAVFAVDRAGLVGSDGETHHGTFDVPYLSMVPGMNVLCPANFAELRTMLKAAIYEYDGPVAVRYPRGGEGDYRDFSGREDSVLLRDGSDVTLVTYGILINEVLTAAAELEKAGISAAVVKLNRISPLDPAPVLQSVQKTKRLVVVEDCVENGSVGQQMAAALSENGIAPRWVSLKNLKGGFARQGRVSQLYQALGIDSAGIVQSVLEAYREQ